eukprot:90572-Rhodomonas_salina.2
MSPWWMAFECSAELPRAISTISSSPSSLGFKNKPTPPIFSDGAGAGAVGGGAALTGADEVGGGMRWAGTNGTAGYKSATSISRARHAQWLAEFCTTGSRFYHLPLPQARSRDLGVLGRNEVSHSTAHTNNLSCAPQQVRCKIIICTPHGGKENQMHMRALYAWKLFTTHCFTPPVLKIQQWKTRWFCEAVWEKVCLHLHPRQRWDGNMGLTSSQKLSSHCLQYNVALVSSQSSQALAWTCILTQGTRWSFSWSPLKPLTSIPNQAKY